MIVPEPRLGSMSETERSRALDRFQIFRPFLEEGVPLAALAREHGIPLRTLQTWVTRYRRHGLAGLCRRPHAGKGKHRLSPNLRQIIEGFALRKPRLSTASVHRKTIAVAQKLEEPVPCYSVVYALVRELDPGLVSLAHEGTQNYSKSFDLVHRTEAKMPNAIWQADHTELDILVKDEHGQAKRPWLTIVLDDYSRAVAGYFVSFAAPSAIQTALACQWRPG